VNEKDLAKYLSDVVQEHEKWSEGFEHLVVDRNEKWTTITWTDSGVGEEYVLRAFEKVWPDRKFDMDIEGGCDSCGYGRHLSLMISGTEPPWEG
jgi:hypothetical protein